MIRTLSLALAAAVVSSTPLDAQSNAAVEKGIHQREVQWRTAISLGNWSAVESFLAPDFVMTDASGERLERAAYLKSIERATTTFAAIPAAEYQTLVFGTTAVHLGEANMLATGSDGGSLRVRVIWTDTWVRSTDGQWLLLASQYMTAPDK